MRRCWIEIPTLMSASQKVGNIRGDPPIAGKLVFSLRKACKRDLSNTRVRCRFFDDSPLLYHQAMPEHMAPTNSLRQSRLLIAHSSAHAVAPARCQFSHMRALSSQEGFSFWLLLRNPSPLDVLLSFPRLLRTLALFHDGVITARMTSRRI